MAIKIFNKFKDRINKLKKIFIDLESISELKSDFEDLKKSKNLLLDRDVQIIKSSVSIDLQKFKLDVEQFDFIENSDVRRQLITDYIKMMITPVYDFDRLCQLSFFQIEQLLNYYYHIRFDDHISKIKDYFKFYYGGNEAPNELENINQSAKVIAFKNEFLNVDSGNVSSYLDNELGEVFLKKHLLGADISKIQYVRNTIHRNAHFNQQNEARWYTKHKEMFPNYRLYVERTSNEMKIINRLKNIDFRREQDFDLVIRRTNSFVRVIKDEIEKQQQKN
jgi:hypothetical protein